MKPNALRSCGRASQPAPCPRQCCIRTSSSWLLRPHWLVCQAGTQPPENGDPKLQESLVDMLQLELAKAKVREDMKQDLEMRKESIKQIGQELVEEFEKELNLDKMRLELESSTTLADTLQQFKELDDEIQGIRDQLQADQQDLSAFEARSANQQNSGLFFKQLYQAPEEPEGPPGSGQAGQQGTRRAKNKEALLDKEAVQQLRSSIQEPAVQEVHSPLRLYIFTYLALVLLWVAGSDIASGGAPGPKDALYLTLALALGWNAWSERQALSKITDQSPPPPPPPPPSPPEYKK